VANSARTTVNKQKAVRPKLGLMQFCLGTLKPPRLEQFRDPSVEFEKVHL
jgi:hypothetical protein